MPYSRDGQTGKLLNDFWKYNPEDNEWTKLIGKPLPGDTGLGIGVSFVFDTSVYVFPYSTGLLGSVNKRILEYIPKRDIWVNKYTLPNEARGIFVGFTFNNLGYALSRAGYVFEFHPRENIWRKRKKIPLHQVIERRDVFYFQIGHQIYVGTPLGNNSQLWSYDIIEDSWNEEIAPDFTANYPFCFSLNNKGFVGGGWGFGPGTDHFSEYNPETKQWQKGFKVLDNFNLHQSMRGLSLNTENYAFFGLDSRFAHSDTLQIVSRNK